LIDPQDAVFGVLEPDHGRDDIEEHPQLGLLPLQRLLGVAPCGDVGEDDDRADNVTRFVAQGGGGVFHREAGPVLSVHDLTTQDVGFKVLTG
jgi:hypothetical protein